MVNLMDLVAIAGLPGLGPAGEAGKPKSVPNSADFLSAPNRDILMLAHSP